MTCKETNATDLVLARSRARFNTMLVRQKIDVILSLGVIGLMRERKDGGAKKVSVCERERVTKRTTGESEISLGAENIAAQPTSSIALHFTHRSNATPARKPQP